MFTPDVRVFHRNFFVFQDCMEAEQMVFLWSFRYNSKLLGAAGNHRQRLAAIRLSSQGRGQQVKPPSLEDHRRRSRYQPRSFANGGKLEGPRLDRNWWEKFYIPGEESSWWWKDKLYKRWRSRPNRDLSFISQKWQIVNLKFLIFC